MSSAIFKKASSKVLDSLYKEESITCISDELRIVKIYIMDNETDPEVIDFINKVLTYFISLLNDNELYYAINNLNLNYLQILFGAINMPYYKHPNINGYIENIFFTPSELYTSRYGILQYVLEKYMGSIFSNPYYQKVFAFANKNESFLIGSKDPYYTLEGEFSLYKSAQAGITTQAYLDFINNKLESERQDPYTESREFINKRIGNIGEYYAYEEIKRIIPQSTVKYFVAKDFKNGYGYDLYFYDPVSGKEFLIEVKTTASYNEEDSFSLSENEFNLLNSHESYNAQYIICRVVLEPTNNLMPTFTYLQRKDENTLVSCSDPTITYEIDKEKSNPKKITFKKAVPNRPLN